MSTPKSRVMHRSLRETPPKAIGGEGVWLIAEDGQRDARCLRRRRRLLPRPSASARARGDVESRPSKLAYAHTGFFSSEPAEALAERLVGHEPGGLAYAYFVSGGSEAIEASIKMARQYFIESGEPQRAAFHRAPPELSRQYARRAGGRRQCLAPRTLCAAAVGRVQPCNAGLCLSRKARRRIRSGFRGAARRRTGGRIPAPRPRHGRGVHRRARGRRHGWMRAAAGRLFPRGARDLRPAWRAAHPRRSDVRHGPHRHAACLGAGGHRARYPGDRKGARRRLPADRRDARRAGASSTRSATAPARSSTAIPISAHPHGLRRRAGGAASDRARSICSTA